MKIEFILREPGRHHVIRTEEGKQPVPRVGEQVAIGEAVLTVHSVCWVRTESTVQVHLDR